MGQVSRKEGHRPVPAVPQEDREGVVVVLHVVHHKQWISGSKALDRLLGTWQIPQPSTKEAALGMTLPVDRFGEDLNRVSRPQPLGTSEYLERVSRRIKGKTSEVIIIVVSFPRHEAILEERKQPSGP